MQINAVKCAFSDSPRLYTYKTDLVLKKGDQVIVETPHVPFAVVEVVAFTTTPIFNPEIPYKWVVDKVDPVRVALSRQYRREEADGN